MDKKTKEKDEQRKQHDQSGSGKEKKDEASRVAEGKNTRQTHNDSSTLFIHSIMCSLSNTYKCRFWY